MSEPNRIRTDPEQILADLDPDQREVATTLDRPVVVLAGAGSGKTRALTHRIGYAIATGAQQAEAVLAVTFTTRAAGELRGRLAAMGLPAVQARTFHSAALRQLRWFWPRTMDRELPALAGSTYGLIAEAAGRAGLASDTAAVRDLSTEISWAKVNNITPEGYVEAALAAGRRLALGDPGQVARAFTGYEAIKTGRGLMDFDDILLCTAALLAEHPEAAQQVRATYRHLVVDEFQDVSPLQRTLVDLWLGEGTDLCVVGDPEQSIHGFAGGSSSFLLGLARELPGARTVILRRNYRSTPQIIELANRVRPAASGRGRQVAVREAGSPVEVCRYGTDREEVTGTAEWLVAQHAQGHDWSQLAVLFRINAQSPPLEAALADAGVPYLVRDGERFYERPEVVRALRLLQHQAELLPSEAAGRSIRDLLTTVGWSPQAPQGSGRVREQWESLQALVDLSDELAVGFEGQDQPEVGLGLVVAALAERAKTQQVPTGQGVTLTTIHSAKGLEWEGVAVIGVREGLIPFALAETDEQRAEEARLLYVACTRARDVLRLSWAGQQGRNRGGSRFLRGLDGRRVVSSASAGRGSRRNSPICPVCGRGLTLARDRKLGHHEDCPVERDEVLVERLREWRLGVARAKGAPAYTVLTDVTLFAIAESRPASRAELMAISGIGERKYELYGEDLLAMIEPLG